MTVKSPKRPIAKQTLGERPGTGKVGATAARGKPHADRGVLSISSKNYSSWCLRGWLLCRMAGLVVEEKRLPIDDASARAELLLLSPSFLVPCLEHRGLSIWDTWAIAEYLHETYPDSGLFPEDVAARTHCRSVCGEMHSGFANMRSALPMNIKTTHPGFKVWVGAQADIDRIQNIWTECLSRYGGPYLFGATPSAADAMYAPVCSRFTTYDVPLDALCEEYRARIMDLPLMQEWIVAAAEEHEDMEELDVEF
jgi:glutathione S-transferase